MNPPLSVPDAVRLANATDGQWRQALAEGIELEPHRSILAADLDRLAEALSVITDWAP